MTATLHFTGKNLSFPTEENLRRFLLDAAECFRERTGMPWSVIGDRALNDPAFIAQVREGRNIKIRTFENFMFWLDRHWPDKINANANVEIHNGRTQHERRRR